MLMCNEFRKYSSLGAFLQGRSVYVTLNGARALLAHSRFLPHLTLSHSSHRLHDPKQRFRLNSIFTKRLYQRIHTIDTTLTGARPRLISKPPQLPSQSSHQSLSQSHPVPSIPEHPRNFGSHSRNFGSHSRNFGSHSRNFGSHHRNFGSLNTPTLPQITPGTSVHSTSPHPFPNSHRSPDPTLRICLCLHFPPCSPLLRPRRKPTAPRAHRLATPFFVFAISFLTCPLILAYPATSIVRLQLVLEANLIAAFTPSWVPTQPFRGSDRRCLPPRPVYNACLPQPSSGSTGSPSSAPLSSTSALIPTASQSASAPRLHSLPSSPRQTPRPSPSTAPSSTRAAPRVPPTCRSTAATSVSVFSSKARPLSQLHLLHSPLPLISDAPHYPFCDGLSCDTANRIPTQPHQSQSQRQHQHQHQQHSHAPCPNHPALFISKSITPAFSHLDFEPHRSCFLTLAKRLPPERRLSLAPTCLPPEPCLNTPVSTSTSPQPSNASTGALYSTPPASRSASPASPRLSSSPPVLTSSPLPLLRVFETTWIPPFPTISPCPTFPLPHAHVTFPPQSHFPLSPFNRTHRLLPPHSMFARHVVCRTLPAVDPQLCAVTYFMPPSPATLSHRFCRTCPILWVLRPIPSPTPIASPPPSPPSGSWVFISLQPAFFVPLFLPITSHLLRFQISPALIFVSCTLLFVISISFSSTLPFPYFSIFLPRNSLFLPLS
ncbi:hypothetical protein BDN71DRAFT_1593743 [Pleurotus eryngii]|uniref:Uncharacterized protein n=1 Tax=Pleurotus eryngii TaxID=5323 RepID=A0A9P6DAU6_PLEER|nr:hypothetical protein BDN71DRAFT_1593743 [Pleurotus eryngii]